MFAWFFNEFLCSKEVKVKWMELTAASLSGGWVPETSRSFHYWQPAPRWRPLPWLASPGNPAISPHVEWQTGTRHTELTVERAGRGMHEDLLPCKTMLTVNPMAVKEAKSCLRPRAHGVLLYAHVKLTPLTTTGTQPLFAVNSLQLHLTACYAV